MSTKSRAPNFTSHEIEKLVELLEINPELVSNKLGGLYKTQSDVKRAWQEIACYLNSSCNGYKRTEKEIKKKWKDLKFTTKKKAAQIKMNENESEEGSCSLPLTSLEKKILKIIGTSYVEGIDDFDNETILLAMNETDENNLNLNNESPPCPLASDVNLASEAESSEVKVFTKFSSNDEKWNNTSKSTPRVRAHREKKRKMLQDLHEEEINNLISINRGILEELKKSNKLKSETLKQLKISNQIRLLKLQKKYNITVKDLSFDV